MSRPNARTRMGVKRCPSRSLGVAPHVSTTRRRPGYINGARARALVVTMPPSTVHCCQSVSASVYTFKWFQAKNDVHRKKERRSDLRKQQACSCAQRSQMCEGMSARPILARRCKSPAMMPGTCSSLQALAR